MQDEHPRFPMSYTWQIIPEKAGDLNPSGKWFWQPGESRVSATCGPSCRHLQPAWLPVKNIGPAFYQIQLSCCGVNSGASAQDSMACRGKTLPRCIVACFPSHLSNRAATLSCLQSGNESTQGLPSFQNRRQQQQRKALCNLAMSDSQQTKSSNHQQGHPPEKVSLHLPSAEPEALWGLGTILKHLWPQSPGQNLAHSRFSTHACWTLEAQMACFSCFSFIFMGFWKCILHFFNYFSSKSKKVFGYCFLKRWFTDENNSLHIDPRVGCFWGLCPQGDKKRPSPRESLTYKGMSHQRGPERQA